ncbi:MAG: MarR family winged helix-turn-helix transcriptional regulator [Solirubrobacteraceae bacterium]
MDSDLPLARLLSAATRAAIDELHTELARQGHPDIRPAHGYALVAVGDRGTTASRLAGVLEMTKQGAAKLVESLESLGYVERAPDEADARARRVILTDRGRDLLRRSAAIQRATERRWARTLGADDARRLRSALERVVDTGEGDDHPPLRPVW